MSGQDFENWSKWMRNAQKGESSDYQKLLGELSQYFRRLGRSKLKRNEFVEELVQECLLSVHKYRHSFDSTHALKPWVNAIFQSRVSDFWKKQGRIQENEMDMDWQEVLSWEAEKEVGKEELQKLEIVLGELPEQQKEIILKIKFEGLSVREVAEIFKMSESAVKVAAHRGYKKIKEAFYEH